MYKLKIKISLVCISWLNIHSLKYSPTNLDPGKILLFGEERGKQINHNFQEVPT